MLLKTVHDYTFQLSLSALVCTNSWNVFMNESACLPWMISIISIILLIIFAIPTFTQKSRTKIIAGQIICHLLFAFLFDADRRLHLFTASALAIRMIDRLSSRQRSLQTNLATRIDIVNDRMRNFGRRYKVGSICLITSFVVVVTCCARASTADFLTSGIRGQLAKARLLSDLCVLVLVSAVGACDTRSLFNAPFTARRSVL